MPLPERNIIWLMFTNGGFRLRQPNWEIACQETLADFRVSCAPYIGNPEFTDLIERLKVESPEFKGHWNHLSVSEKRNSFKEFNHPILGQLKFEMMMLQMNDPTNTKLVLFVPTSDSSTKQKLDQLEMIERSPFQQPQMTVPTTTENNLTLNTNR